MKTGIELIIQERTEQITKHNRTVDHDIECNNEYQLPDAAVALVQPIPEGMEGAYIESCTAYPPIGWDKEYWAKVVAKPYKDRLMIAGALIAAEIDRINAITQAESKVILSKAFEEEDAV